MRQFNKKLIVIPGGATGSIAFPFARLIGSHGANLVITSRKLESAQQATGVLAEEEIQAFPYALDLASSESIQTFIADMQQLTTQLNKPIEGLYIFPGTFRLGPELIEFNGLTCEYGVAVQLLGPVSLIHGLLPYIKGTITSPAQVLLVSSEGNAAVNSLTLSDLLLQTQLRIPLPNKLKLDDRFGQRTLIPWMVKAVDEMQQHKWQLVKRLQLYCETKLALILFAKGIASQIKDKNIAIYSVHPGMHPTTSMVEELVEETNGTKFFQLIQAIMQLLSDHQQETSSPKLFQLIENAGLSQTGQYFDLTHRRPVRSECVIKAGYALEFTEWLNELLDIHW